MSIWVSAKRAAKFPAVINFYHKASLFLKTVKAGGVWIRLPPAGAAVSKQDAQVDVTAIPGVPALRKDGHR